MSAKPEQMAVAYLDLGVGGYIDIGTDLSDEALAALPKGRHMLGIIGTYGVEGYTPAQPAAITELLDRLEAAEKAVTEAYQRGYATGQEEIEKERDALRAKIEEMERQEPVAWLHESRCDSDVVTNAVKHVWGKAAVGSMAAYSIPLYTLPGAQPAPSVPDELIYVPLTFEAARDEISYLYVKGWNDCRKAMISAATKQEGE